jgi:predicted DNA-binding ribbon-helix-helix protein
MCHLFASQNPDSYVYETRSIRLNGQSTSIRLERIFWNILEQIAAREGLSVPSFISTLHNEVLLMWGPVPNFTSHLRCICLVALQQRATELPAARGADLTFAPHLPRDSHANVKSKAPLATNG